jgi:hypothetical protein
MSYHVSTSIRLDQSRIARLLRLPGGFVDRDLRRRMQRVENEARRLAPGGMKDGIRSQIRYAEDGPVGTITSTHPATIYVTYGTRPHEIRPVRARALRFTVGGRVVYAAVVRHPGTQPNHFLRDALQVAR